MRDATDLRRNSKPPEARAIPAKSINSGSPPVLTISPVGATSADGVVPESSVVVGSAAKSEPTLVTALASPAADPPEALPLEEPPEDDMLDMPLELELEPELIRERPS